MITKTGITPVKFFICVSFLLCILIVPVHAFTSNSLDITIDTSGNAVANFQFTLEGFVETSIPQSMLETELVKGLTTSSDPPQVLSFDRSSASLLLKKFAVKNDVPKGTEYQTMSMDFFRAESALKNSALGSIVSADFSPAKLVVKFPDGYTREFTDSAVLPSLKHTVIDPSKAGAGADNSSYGSIAVNSSPIHARIFVDDTYAGNTPTTFPEIAPGSHKVSLEMDEFLPYTRTVNVTAGETTTVNAVLSYIAPTPTKRATGFGLICTGIALIGCGIVFSRRARR